MMKQLLLAGLLTLAGAPLAYGQAGAPAAKPRPKDNVILVQTTDSAAVALRKLAAVFVGQGFTVERMDAQYLTLALAPKVLDNRYSPTVVFRAAAAANGGGSITKLTGDYKGLYGTIPLVGIAEFTGGEIGCNKMVFRALERAALAYPDGKVSYSRQ